MWLPLGRCLLLLSLAALVCGLHRRPGADRSFPKASFAVPRPGPVTTLPGWSGALHGHFAGHVVVNATCEAAVWFWFADAANNDTASPVVLWLNGGPGFASSAGALYENGPFRVAPDLSLRANPFAWNRRMAYLAIDQPAGTGKL